MNFEQFLFITPQILSSLIFLAMIIFFSRQKKTPLLNSFMLFIICLFIWVLTSIFELSSTTDEMTIIWTKLTYISACSMPIILYLFVFTYMEHKTALLKKHIILISIIPAISFILALTNSFHHLFFAQELTVTLSNGLTAGLLSETTPYWIFVADTYLKICIVFFFLIKKLLDKNFANKQQILLVILALAIPFIGNIISVVKPFGMSPEYDLTPVLFVLTAILLYISIFRYNLINISSIARNQIFDEIEDSLIILNEKNEIVDFNKKAIELAKKMKIKELKAGMDAKELLKNTKLNIENDAEFSLSNGAMLYYDSTVKKMLINKEPVGIIVSIKDITRIKELEKLKAETKKDKEISNLREEFITRISHELRQPLMPIIGYSSELKSLVKGKKANEYIEKIIFNSENLKEMIEKTIKLTQIKTQSKNNMEKKKLSKVIQNIIADERIHKKIIKDAEVLIDESQLLEAINNVVQNAINYSKNEVTIEIDEIGKNAVISIIDKGKGIPKELITDLLKGNYLAKVDASELRKGFGIGLLITKMIIEMHNGTLEIESAEGKGTTVKITLPVA